MLASRILWATSLSLVLVAVACERESANADPAEPAPEQPPVAPVPPKVDAPSEPPPPTEPQLARATVEWVELPGLDEVTSLERISRGVLALCFRNRADYCELTEQGKLVSSKFDDTNVSIDDILGTWPDDAWLIETERDLLELGDDERAIVEYLTTRRWTGTRWVQHRKHEFRFDIDGPDFMMADRVARASWSGGLVISHVSSGRVFNGLEPGKTLATFGVGEVWTVTQTPAGNLIAFVVGEAEMDGPYIMAMSPCLGDACRQASGYPIGNLLGGDPRSHWQLVSDVPRGGDAMSFVLRSRDQAVLLHFDPPAPGVEVSHDNWTDEDLPKLGSDRRWLDDIWTDEQGGLWMSYGRVQMKNGRNEVEDLTLIHRTPAGVWCLVDPPPGYVFDSFAGRAKPGELIAYAKNQREYDFGVFAARGPVTLVR